MAAAPKANTGAALAADLVQLAQADQGWRGAGGGPADAGLDLSLLTACLLPSAEVRATACKGGGWGQQGGWCWWGEAGGKGAMDGAEHLR